jgi:branched-chain amino acid transport system substrate-binding protein
MRPPRYLTVLPALAIGLALMPGSSATGAAPAAAASYVIGCEGPLSGPNDPIGLNSCRAVELAVQLANRGGTLPYRLGVRLFDDQGDPVHAPATATEAVSDILVLAVIGPSFSGTALAAGQIYANAHLLTVTASATLPALTAPRNKLSTFYRAVASDSTEGLGAGRYLAHLKGVTRVAVVDDGSAYGQSVARAAAQALRARHVRVSRLHLGDSPNLTHEAKRIKSDSASAVYFGGYDTSAGRLAKALHKDGYAGRFVGDDAARTTTFITHAGKAAAAAAEFTSPYVDAATYGPAKTFVAEYRHRFHRTPGETSVEAFDAANSVILDLSKLSGMPTRAAVTSTYRTIHYAGIAKPISFTSRHELKRPKIFLYRVRSRRFELVRRLPA